MEEVVGSIPTSSTTLAGSIAGTTLAAAETFRGLPERLFQPGRNQPNVNA